VFENIDFELPLNASSLEQIQQQMVLANIEDKWFDVIVQMVNQVLSVCLDSDELQLSAIPAKSRLVEMEFLFPITSINAAHLTRISQQYDQLSAQADELTFHDVEGMLKGFIDLVFEYRGRFYVLDWKSNHLGNDSSFYQPEALEQAMMAHRYDLQYQIYTLALHRFLSSRIKDYDYDKHIGGVFYIFLRGVNVAHGQSGVFYTCPRREHIEALDGYFRGETGQLGENQQMELGL
jgi:exodeoxyribonuclease V beta subunit